MKAAIGIFLFIVSLNTPGIFAKESSKTPVTQQDSRCCSKPSPIPFRSIAKWTAIFGLIFLMHEQVFAYIDQQYPDNKYRADAIKEILKGVTKVFCFEEICRKLLEAKDVIEYTSHTVLDENSTDTHAQHA